MQFLHKYIHIFAGCQFQVYILYTAYIASKYTKYILCHFLQRRVSIQAAHPSLAYLDVVQEYVYLILCVCVICGSCSLSERVELDVKCCTGVKCVWSWVDAEEVKCSFDVVVGYMVVCWVHQSNGNDWNDVQCVWF